MEVIFEISRPTEFKVGPVGACVYKESRESKEDSEEISKIYTLFRASDCGL